jgi:hypothetical protein
MVEELLLYLITLGLTGSLLVYSLFSDGLSLPLQSPVWIVTIRLPWELIGLPGSWGLSRRLSIWIDNA